jgi:hypothetical protein
MLEAVGAIWRSGRAGEGIVGVGVKDLDPAWL